MAWRLRFIIAALLLLGATAARAGPADDLVRSMGIVLGDEVAEAIEAPLRSEFARLDGNPQAASALGRIALSMAELSRIAIRPATRLVMQDMHREFVTSALGPGSVAVKAFDGKDPMIAEIAPGLGITRQDVAWGAWLEMVRQGEPRTDPMSMAVDEKAYALAAARFEETWHTSSKVQRMFLVRIDAWAAGTAFAWNGLDATERDAVAHAVERDDIPPASAMVAVTGTADIIDWLSGLHVGLTDEEKAAHPALADYLRSGGMSAAMAPLLAEREAIVAAAVAMAELSTLSTMTNLNTWIQSGGNAAGVLGGLE